MRLKFKTVSSFVLCASLSLIVVAPLAVSAQGFVPLAPIPGLTDTGSAVVDATSLASFFNNLYKYCIGLAAALAVIMIIWGGLEISTQDSISKQGAGKEKIQNAIFGLVLVLSPVLVFSIINPAILNLSLNLRALDTRSSAPADNTNTTTLSDTETLDRPTGVSVLFAFEVNQNLSPRDVVQILNTKQRECTDARGGPGIIVPITLQTTQRRFSCQTCEPGKTPALRSCSITNFTCGNCQ